MSSRSFRTFNDPSCVSTGSMPVTCTRRDSTTSSITTSSQRLTHSAPLRATEVLIVACPLPCFCAGSAILCRAPSVCPPDLYTNRTTYPQTYPQESGARDGLLGATAEVPQLGTFTHSARLFHRFRGLIHELAGWRRLVTTSVLWNASADFARGQVSTPHVDKRVGTRGHRRRGVSVVV